MKILALLVTLGMLTLLPAGVMAQEAPHRLSGTVFLLDGTLAPDGTEVAAIVGGDVVATTTVESSFQPGFYLLNVVPPAAGAFAGQTVFFTIDGEAAGESVPWQIRGFDQLDLNVALIPPDTTSPVLTGLGGIVVDAEIPEGTSVTNSSIVAFLSGVAATDDRDSSPVITNDAPALFPAGQITLVTFTATDEAGNQSTGTATVTVNSFALDITAPVLTLLDDIVVESETAEGTPITNPDISAFLRGATATDDRDTGSVVITHDAPVLFQGGQVTVVTFTATDETGNESTGTATVTVNSFPLDITAPVITLPDNIVVEPETAEGTAITNPLIDAFLTGATATDDRDSDPLVTHDAPALFPSGRDTVVTFTATDETGNESTGTATVTVDPFAIPIPEIEVKTEVTVDPENTVIVDVQGVVIELVDAPVAFQQVEELIVLALPVAPDTGKLESFEDPTTGITIVGTEFTIPIRDEEDKVVFTFTGQLEEAPEFGQAVAAELRLETAEDLGTVDLADLDSRVGAVTVLLDTEIVSLVEAPIINLEVGTDIGRSVQIALGELARQDDRQVSGDVGAVLNIDTNLDNRDAQLKIKIGIEWVKDVVEAVTPGDFDEDDLDRIDAVIWLGRLDPESGEAQLLPATCTGPEDGRYACTANSPEGFSIFGLLALPPVDRPSIPILALEPPGSITVEVDTLGGASLENADIQEFLVSSEIGEGSAAEVIVIEPDPLPPVFEEGTHRFTFVATDDIGNLATDSATITVVSTVPPTLRVPDGLVIDSQEQPKASDPRLQRFLGEARATSVLDGELAVTNDSPDVFDFGDTVVTFTATDSSGKQTTATATVTVNSLEPDLQVTGVQVTPDRVFGDRPVTVVVQVENSGTAAGSIRLEIRLDDRVVESVNVTLKPGDFQTVTQEIVGGTVGKHRVEVAGNAATFRVVGEPLADISLAGLQVNPAGAESPPGFSLTFRVENLGEVAGELDLVLRLDGQVLEEVTVSLEPGQSDTIDRDFPVDLAPGSHVVQVDGISESFQVGEPGSGAVSPVAGTTPGETTTSQEAGSTGEAGLVPATPVAQEVAQEEGPAGGGCFVLASGARSLDMGWVLLGLLGLVLASASARRRR